jgi:signal transduction histidine kinase
VVQDHGIGLTDDFDEESGRGIQNIRKRARKIRDELDLETDHANDAQCIMSMKMG